jgi:hypothetical protein
MVGVHQQADNKIKKQQFPSLFKEEKTTTYLQKDDKKNWQVGNKEV